MSMDVIILETIFYILLSRQSCISHLISRSLSLKSLIYASDGRARCKINTKDRRDISPLSFAHHSPHKLCNSTSEKFPQAWAVFFFFLFFIIETWSIYDLLKFFLKLNTKCKKKKIFSLFRVPLIDWAVLVRKKKTFGQLFFTCLCALVHTQQTTTRVRGTGWESPLADF